MARKGKFFFPGGKAWFGGANFSPPPRDRLAHTEPPQSTVVGRYRAKLCAFRGRRGRVRSARAKLDAAHQSPAAGRVVYDGSRVRRAERRARAALARQRR